MKIVEWIDLKRIAQSLNATKRLIYIKEGPFYVVDLNEGNYFLRCKIKESTDEGKDFKENFIPYLVSTTDDSGKQYVTLYSGNQNYETVVYTTRGDTNDIIGGGESTIIDASLEVNTGGRSFDTDTTKSTYIYFNSSYRILKGELTWSGGDIDCYGDCYVVAPEGTPIGIDESGNPILAPVEISLSHFVIEHHMMGDGTVLFQGERATDLIPSYYPIKIVWNKPQTNNTLKAVVRFDIYRGSSV